MLPSSGGRSRRSPATSPEQYPAGSGVGVSVLLRQPHGFEGRSAFGVDHQSYCLATSHCRDVRGTRLRLHATSFSCSANVNEDHDLIAHVEESLGFHPQVVPNLKEALN